MLCLIYGPQLVLVDLILLLIICAAIFGYLEEPKKPLIRLPECFKPTPWELEQRRRLQEARKRASRR